MKNESSMKDSFCAETVIVQRKAVFYDSDPQSGQTMNQMI